MDSDNSAQPEDSIRRGKNTGGGGGSKRESNAIQNGQHNIQAKKLEKNRINHKNDMNNLH